MATHVWRDGDDAIVYGDLMKRWIEENSSPRKDVEYSWQHIEPKRPEKEEIKWSRAYILYDKEGKNVIGCVTEKPTDGTPYATLDTPITEFDRAIKPAKLVPDMEFIRMKYFNKFKITL